MDAESLTSLGTLLFWGLLFFVMMRIGCGAHIGGHGHHGSHGKSDEPAEGATLYGAYFRLVFAPLYYFFADRSQRGAS